jgi:hypothetical protein
MLFFVPLHTRIVYGCSIVASELVSDITVRIGTTKFYLHKVNTMFFYSCNLLIFRDRDHKVM